MRPIIIFLALAGAGIIAWLLVARPGQTEEVPKQAAIAISKHSEAFNTGIDAVLAQYDALTERFVNWDSTAAVTQASQLTEALNSINLNELKKDSAAIYETALMFVDNAKANAQTVATEKSIRAQREAFNGLTDNLYQFLNTVRYDHQAVFLQECPMAFDDTQAAQWLSKNEEIRNPYLGLHHPVYGKGMLSCGETKTKINHAGKE